MQRKPIKNQNDAKVIWQQFNRKYKADTKAKPLRPKLDPIKINDELIRRKIKSELGEDELHKLETKEKDRFIQIKELYRRLLEKNARRLQKWWSQKTTEDMLVKVNLRGTHSETFKDFVRSDKNIKKSINKTKLDGLLQALKKADWEDPIFADKTLPQLTLSLFGADKISQHQLFTILERSQLGKDYPIFKTYKILDANGQFTPEAEKFLKPLLQDLTRVRLALTEGQLEEFRLLVASLPPSEQIFYTTPIGENYGGDIKDQVIRAEAVLTSRNSFYHLSSGVRDALGLARFGIDEYVRPIPSLHKKTIDDIEKGTNLKSRPAALYFSETVPYDDIHGNKGVDYYVATAHDVYHSNILSLLPKSFLPIFENLIATTRKITGQKWSKELWTLVDAEFPYILAYNEKLNYNNLKQMTDYFCQIMTFVMNPATKVILKNDNLSFFGILMMLDMIKNYNTWKNDYYVDPAKLIAPLDKYYRDINDIYKYVRNDDPKLQIFKIQLYFKLKQNKDEHLYSALNEIINEHKDEILAKLNFKKYTTKEDPRITKIENNTLDLLYGDKRSQQVAIDEILVELENKNKLRL